MIYIAVINVHTHTHSDEISISVAKIPDGVSHDFLTQSSYCAAADTHTDRYLNEQNRPTCSAHHLLPALREK